MDPALLMTLFPLKQGRVLTFMAKMTLSNPLAEESQFVLDRRSKKPTEKNQLQQMLAEAAYPLVRWYNNGFGAHFVDLGNPRSRYNLQAMRGVLNDLNKGRLIALFPEGTRRPPYDLLDTVDGVVNIAKRNPEVPIYPVGISKKKILFGESTTYQELVLEHGEEGVIAGIMNRIALNLPVENKPAWWLKNVACLPWDVISEMRDRNPDLATAVEILNICYEDGGRSYRERAEELKVWEELMIENKFI